MLYDSIVIGKGPAGISAAIYMKRANLNVLVIGRKSEALDKAEKIDNYYGFENGITGKQLYSAGIKQALNLEIKIIEDEVVGINFETNFIVKTRDSEFHTKTIILATGANRTEPKIEGIKKFEGRGISYCAVCDGFFYRDKNVAVLGNGDYAISEAKELIPFAKSVTLLTNGREPVQNRDIPIEINEKKIKKITGKETVEKINFEDKTNLKVSGIFVAEGIATSLDLAKKIGINIKDNNIIVDENCRTNVAGVYAAGDCIKGIKQISKAVYQGMIAGLSAIEDIRKI